MRTYYDIKEEEEEEEEEEENQKNHFFLTAFNRTCAHVPFFATNTPPCSEMLCFQLYVEIPPSMGVQRTTNTIRL